MPITEAFLKQIESNDPALTKLDLSYQQLIDTDIKKLICALKDNNYVTALNLKGNVLKDDCLMLLTQYTNLMTLDLTGNDITPAGVPALMEMKSLVTLDLSYTLIQDEGVRILAAHPTVKTLSLNGNQLTSQAVIPYAKNTVISRLSLMDNDVDVIGAIALAENTSLKELYLINNYLGTQGAIALAETKNITLLCVNYNQISGLGGEAFAQNKSIKTLYIASNTLGDYGAVALAKTTTLQFLCIANNQINSPGISALAENNSLTSLDVSYNIVGNKQACELARNPRLKHLDLSYNQVSYIGAIALAQHSNLNSLVMRYNALGNQGAIALAQSKSLAYLDMVGNSIGLEAAIALAGNSKLITLILSNNDLCDAGAVVLSESTTLNEIALSYNKIGDAGALALATNSSIKILNLNYNQIGIEGKKALKYNKNFITLRMSEDQPPEFTEKNLELLFLLAQDFLCIIGLDGKIQFFNPAFSRMLGYSDEELLNTSLIDLLHPADRFENHPLAKLNQKFPLHDLENRFLSKDGSYRLIRWSTKLKDTRIYSVGTDITDQRNAERRFETARKLKELNAVRVKEAKINAQNQAEFIAHLCHEIRNPLSGSYSLIEVMRSYIQSIKSTIIKPDFQLQDKKAIGADCTAMDSTLSDMTICAEHQKSILNDNLDIAKIGNKKLVLERKPFDINILITEAVSVLRANITLKKLAFPIHLLPEPTFVKSDPLRIKQIVINLLSNAVKFTEKGKVELIISIHEQTASFTRFQIKVIDTGIGLTQEEIDTLFNRYTQANISSGQYGGTGLGLVISKQLAQLMGGDITIESEKGRGSTFSCTIQCENLTKEERLGQETIKPALISNLDMPIKEEASNKLVTVMIVDDNEINRKSLGFILNKAGYKCLFASDGKQALAQYESHTEIDIILMDVLMPNMSGLEATREIRERERQATSIRSKTPIIALTGNALENDKKEAFAVGMDGYLVKPFKKEEIYEMITSQLSDAKMKEKMQVKSKIEEHFVQSIPVSQSTVPRSMNRSEKSSNLSEDSQPSKKQIDERQAADNIIDAPLIQLCAANRQSSPVAKPLYATVAKRAASATMPVSRKAAFLSDPSSSNSPHDTFFTHPETKWPKTSEPQEEFEQFDDTDAVKHEQRNSKS